MATFTPTIIRVTELSSIEELTTALHQLNHRAALTKPSPAWDALHGAINEVLDWLVGR